MRILLCLFLLIVCFTNCKSQVDENLQYLNQKRPSTDPEVFAPGIISKESQYEFGSVFNKAGTAFYYGVNANGKEEIRFSQLVDGQWSKPKTILSHKQYGYNDPFLSPDENRLYFISRRAMDGKGKLKDYDIWYSEKTPNGWSDPINAGPNINSTDNEYYISFTNDGTMFFSSNKNGSDFDIYSASFLDGAFQQAVPLGDSINTAYYEADVFIDPAESYVIFCANRPDGMGEGDLYISFKKEDGTWTQSKNMGTAINSEYHELCPFVSKDGKYFFYTSNKDIYWVSAEVIEEIRSNN